MSSLRTRSQIQAHLRNVLQPTRNNEPGPSREKADEDAGSNSLPQVSNVEQQPIESMSSYSENGEDDDMDDMDSTNDIDMEARPPTRGRLIAPFPKAGKVIFENKTLRIEVKEVAHKKYSRFNVGDHLYSINLEVKPGKNTPLLLDIEDALGQAMIRVLDKLKTSYSDQEDFQVYATIIGRGIKSGINTGNYSLRTPSDKIVRWMLSMLYNYLKSKQTMKLNSTFHVKVKVLSVEHTNDLATRRSKKFKHVLLH